MFILQYMIRRKKNHEKIEHCIIWGIIDMSLWQFIDSAYTLLKFAVVGILYFFVFSARRYWKYVEDSFTQVHKVLPWSTTNIDKKQVNNNAKVKWPMLEVHKNAWQKAGWRRENIRMLYMSILYKKKFVKTRMNFCLGSVKDVCSKKKKQVKSFEFNTIAERYSWHTPGVLAVNFEYILHNFLVPLMVTLNRHMFAG